MPAAPKRPSSIPSADQPEELASLNKWSGAVRTHLAPPNLAWFCAVAVGIAAALLSSPPGRIATFIEQHPIGHDWLPVWLPWWRVVIFIVVAVAILVSLLLVKHRENRLTVIQKRLATIRNLLIVLNVDVTRVSDGRCTILCYVRTFRPLSDVAVPSVIFMGTTVDGQKHSLTYSKTLDAYEGGADAAAFYDAIKRDMLLTDVGRGPRFLRVSLTTHDKAWRVVGADDENDTTWLVAAYDTELRVENESAHA